MASKVINEFLADIMLNRRRLAQNAIFFVKGEPKYEMKFEHTYRGSTILDKLVWTNKQATYVELSAAFSKRLRYESMIKSICHDVDRIEISNKTTSTIIYEQEEKEN